MSDNIAMGYQAPQVENPMTAMSQAYGLKDLAQTSQLKGVQLQQANQAFNDDQSMRQSMMKATSVDPNTGQASFDKDAALKNLASSSPWLVPKAQLQFAQNDQERTKLLAQQAADAGQALNGVKDENSYQAVKGSALARSSGSDKWPSNYDPNFIGLMANQAQTHQQYLDNQIKQQDVDNKKQQLALDSFKVFGNPGGPVPAGTPVDANGKITTDPAAFVMKKAPVDLRGKVNDELTMAATAAKAAPDAMGSFWKAANNQHVADYIPGLPFGEKVTNVDQKALATALDPTFKDADPGARQAARDAFIEKVTPRFGDNQNTINTKAQMLQAHFNTRLYAPSAKEAGIDTNKFAMTSVDNNLFKNPNGGPSGPPDGSTKQWNGKTYQVSNGHWVVAPTTQVGNR